MQTFLPYPDFKQSLECLDYRRLGKQRLEAFQILNIILNRTDKKGWRNHPAVLMWKNYPNALKEYYNTALQTWINKGYKNNMKFEKISGKIIYPAFVGDEDFHNSHKSNLLRKKFDFYSQYNWNLPDNLPYLWPKN